MQSHDYWQIFLETGAPELYLLYNSAKKMESTHVFDDQRPGSAGNELQ